MASNAVVVVVVIIVAAAAGGLGFWAGYEYKTTPAATPGTTENSTLSIQAAGTLNAFFPQIASQLVNETPGISAPASAQTYQGSLDVITAITALHATVDVAAVADYRLIPQSLEPTYASYEVVFGATPEVLVYNPAIPAFNGINATNWAEKLVAAVNTHGNAPFAVWNASTDPNGYNEIFSLQLQGMIYNGSTGTYYNNLYSGGSTSPAVSNPANTKLEKESQAATLIHTGVVSCLITYRSYAVANHLTFVSFDPIVGLQANNTTALDDYAKLSTTIVSSTGSFTSVHPAPVLFAVTVPLNAPNPALGAAFISLLLSPQGAAIIGAGGAFTPIFPGWVDHTSAVPPLLAPDVTPLPAWAANLLT
jgi:molybdate/tungstate transport system substrate-binding protein